MRAVRDSRLVMHCPEPTARLQFRPPCHADADFVRELVMQPAWQRFIGSQDLPDAAAARAYIEQRLLSHLQREGMGLWVCETRDTQQPMGLCGLLRRSGLPGPDLGFALLPEFWRQGLGQESARQVLSWGFGARSLSAVWAICHPDNHASRRVLQRLGFVPDGVYCPPEEATALLRWVCEQPAPVPAALVDTNRR